MIMYDVARIIDVVTVTVIHLFIYKMLSYRRETALQGAL